MCDTACNLCLYCSNNSTTIASNSKEALINIKQLKIEVQATSPTKKSVRAKKLGFEILETSSSSKLKTKKLRIKYSKIVSNKEINENNIKMGKCQVSSPNKQAKGKEAEADSSNVFPLDRN